MDMQNLIKLHQLMSEFEATGQVSLYEITRSLVLELANELKKKGELK